MKKEEFYFDSRDNKSKIHAVKWMPEGRPTAVLQIVHGMAENIRRYDKFAGFLAEKGILVTGEDHLGHGESAKEQEQYGYFCEKDAATVLVRDVHRLKKMVQDQNPGVPYFIMGHSMGSFILRNYLCRYGTGIDGAIIMGTGMQPAALLKISKALTRFLAVFQGWKKRSALIDRLAFGNYNKKIPYAKSKMSWLSTDEAVVDAYDRDPKCGFLFTLNGFHTLFTLIDNLHDNSQLKKMPRDLPILFLSGEEDPVGNYGNSPREVVQSFRDLGMTQIKEKYYPGLRHELLNENGKEQVYEDILFWLEQNR